MVSNPSGLDLIKLTLFVYMDGIHKVLTKKRTVLATDSMSFGSINSQDKEVQSTLDRFYTQKDEDDLIGLSSIDLIFVNSIFHKTNAGNLESYKNRLPAFLFYHKEFFNVPVSHEHIAQRLTGELEEWQSRDKSPALWFHLRNYNLYVLFSAPKGDSSIKSFEVRKTLDVYYYILFNIQTLQPVIPDLKQVTISGELLNMDNIQPFFLQNVPEKELIPYWKWKDLRGNPPSTFSQYLPEVLI